MNVGGCSRETHLGVVSYFTVSITHTESKMLTQTSVMGSSSLFVFSATPNKVEDVSQASQERLFQLISSFITHFFVIGSVLNVIPAVYANIILSVRKKL